MVSDGDINPRIPSTQVYAGSQAGNVYQVVYQVVACPHEALDCPRIAPWRDLKSVGGSASGNPFGVVDLPIRL